MFSAATDSQVTHDFTQGITNYGKILDRLIKDLNNTTIRINGGAWSMANQLQQVIPRSGNGGGGGNDCQWKVDAVCSMPMVREACPQHGKCDCQFSHDAAKASAIRSDKAHLAKIEARLEQREQVRRERQPRSGEAGGAAAKRTTGGRGGGSSGHGGAGGSGSGRAGGGRGGSGRQVPWTSVSGHQYTNRSRTSERSAMRRLRSSCQPLECWAGWPALDDQM